MSKYIFYVSGGAFAFYICYLHLPVLTTLALACFYVVSVLSCMASTIELVRDAVMQALIDE